MQEEINQKTIALCIKGGKISADVLRTSLKYLLQQMQKESGCDFYNEGGERKDHKRGTVPQVRQGNGNQTG